MAKEKRFVEDYNEPDEEETEQELSSELTSKNFNLENEDNEDLESEIQEDEEVPNIFEDNFGSFSSGFRGRASSVSASLESEPIQNLERGLQDVPTNQEQQKTEAPEVPMMYNAPQYGSNYDAKGYEAMRSETADVTGGASTANLGREINMKRWQETAMGYPGQSGGSQGEKYIRTPEKQKESRALPFERGTQGRNVEWKEDY